MDHSYLEISTGWLRTGKRRSAAVTVGPELVGKQCLAKCVVERSCLDLCGPPIVLNNAHKLCDVLAQDAMQVRSSTPMREGSTVVKVADLCLRTAPIVAEEMAVGTPQDRHGRNQEGESNSRYFFSSLHSCCIFATQSSSPKFRLATHTCLTLSFQELPLDLP